MLYLFFHLRRIRKKRPIFFLSTTANRKIGLIVFFAYGELQKDALLLRIFFFAYGELQKRCFIYFFAYGELEK